MITYLVDRLLNLYEMLLLIRVLMSWVRPDPYHPVVRFIRRATDPVLEPARAIIPPLGGLDISPILVFLALGWFRRLLIGALMRLGV